MTTHTAKSPFLSIKLDKNTWQVSHDGIGYGNINSSCSVLLCICTVCGSCETMLTLWNDKSKGFADYVPLRAWRCQPSQQIDKVSEGQRPEYLLNAPSTLPTTIAFNYIYGVISRTYATDSFEIQQIINWLTVHDWRVGASAQVHAYSMKQ